MPLSVVIHTKNAANTLKGALKSVSFADQIVVIDMQSQDQTLAIAEQFGAEIHAYDDVGYADPARNFGLKQAVHEWVLVLDADEEIPVGLKTLILTIVNGQVPADQQADAYFIARKNISFGQWLRHTGWWPDFQLRLFKKGTVKWQKGVHRLPETSGKTAYLPAQEAMAILHYNYQTVEDFIERLNRYTTIKAKEETAQTATAANLIETFGREFVSRLFAQQGLQDGTHGTAMALLQANYEVTVQLKRWQRAGFKARTNQVQAIDSLRQFQQQLNYWIADWQIQRTSGLEQWWWRLRRKYQF